MNPSRCCILVVANLAACDRPVAPRTLYGTWIRDVEESPSGEAAHVRVYEQRNGADVLHYYWMDEDGTITDRFVGTFAVQPSDFVSAETLWTSENSSFLEELAGISIVDIDRDSFVITGGSTYVRDDEFSTVYEDTGE